MTQNNSMKTLIPEDAKELDERNLNLKEKAPTRESLILEL